MGLLNLKAEAAKIEPKGEAGLLILGGNPAKLFCAERGQLVADVMPEVLSDDYDYHYLTKARWSAVDMLGFMLGLCAPAVVHISTWSINEDAARKILVWKGEGLISDIKILLDKKVKVRNPKPLQMLMSLEKLSLIECHAKVTIVEGNGLTITNCGSANYNKNRRIETGILFTRKEVAEFHKKWMNGEIE